MPDHVIHWDELESFRPSAGFIGATWRELGRAAGSVRVGLRRIDMAPGEIPTPPHVHHDEEEIFFVLDGSGLSWQDGKTYAVRAGDALVHRVNAAAHTVRAGDDGLSVLAFGQRSPGFSATLPRSEVKWSFPYWIEVGVGDAPWEREAKLGPPDFPEPEADRPETIRNLDEVEPIHGRRGRPLTRGVSERTGLNWLRLEDGETGAPRHCHSAEEELFVVLGGEGTLYLDEEHAVRGGHVVSRPAGTGVAHGFRGGAGGLTMLAYGERRSEDICFYPTSGRIAFCGVGVLGRVEPLPYPGEPELF